MGETSEKNEIYKIKTALFHNRAVSGVVHFFEIYAYISVFMQKYKFIEHQTNISLFFYSEFSFFI